MSCILPQDCSQALSACATAFVGVSSGALLTTIWEGPQKGGKWISSEPHLNHTSIPPPPSVSATDFTAVADTVCPCVEFLNFADTFHRYRVFPG